MSAKTIHLISTSSPATNTTTSPFSWKKTPSKPHFQNMNAMYANTLNEFPNVVATACPENVVP